MKKKTNPGNPHNKTKNPKQQQRKKKSHTPQKINFVIKKSEKNFGCKRNITFFIYGQ